jgi:AbrB family looped-hinge helix DNA binding protein
MSEGGPTTKIVRPLRGGQITIPAAFRRQLGIGDDSLLQVTLDRDELRIKPVRVTEQGSPWFRELYELFAPVRQEAIEKGYTDEQINAWIDEAVEAVRRERR